ncbi:hypothetical protein WKK05_10265 [Nostoc sp. UHCC 0302]
MPQALQQAVVERSRNSVHRWGLGIRELGPLWGRSNGDRDLGLGIRD